MRISEPLSGLRVIHAPGVAAFLLEDERGFVLIDTGLVRVPAAVRQVVRDPGSLRAILLTHGHLDHAAGLAELVAWSGATVFAHPAEQRHVDGRFPYRGLARACGMLEAVGRVALRYRRTSIDVFVSDGQELPLWGGLCVVHLPGHTAGHCGYFSPSRGVLFAGDLFAVSFFGPHRPPPILNCEPGRIEDSLRRVDALAPDILLPCHYPPRLSPEQVTERFRRWRELEA